MISIKHYPRSAWPFVVTLKGTRCSVSFHYHYLHSNPVAMFLAHKGEASWFVWDEFERHFKRKHRGVAFESVDNATFALRSRFAIRLVAFDA